MKHYSLKNQTKAAVFTNLLTSARPKRITLKRIIGCFSLALFLSMSSSAYARSFTPVTATLPSEKQALCFNDIEKPLKIGGEYLGEEFFRGDTSEELRCTMPLKFSTSDNITHHGIQPKVYRGNRATLTFDSISNNQIKLRVDVKQNFLTYLRRFSRSEKIVYIMLAIQDSSGKVVSQQKRFRLRNRRLQYITVTLSPALDSNKEYTITAQLRQYPWFDIIQAKLGLPQDNQPLQDNKQLIFNPPNFDPQNSDMTQPNTKRPNTNQPGRKSQGNLTPEAK